MNKHTINSIKNKIDQTITKQCLPVLMDYIAIPCKSPAFDPEWQKNGYIDAAMQLFFDYTKKQNITGLTAEIIRLEKRTPLLFIDIPASPGISHSNTVLLYGHMDKQPEMSGWDPDKGPWRPVLQDDKLYGRGGADDGYALFSALLAIQVLQEHHIPHARCVIIIEACEESGSYDLPAYLTALKHKIGTPNLVICLDSSAGNYEQLWCTTSLRGIIGGQLDIQVTKEGIHSGLGSGVVPPIELILRQLLNRLEDPNTGQIIPPEFSVNIPKQRIQEAKQVAQQLGKAFLHSYPFIGDTQAVSQDVHELILNRSWRAQLSITGLEGYPKLRDAGNVTLPKASLKLSLRIPPTADAEQLSQALKTLLETNPPFNAHIHFTPNEAANGWHAPEPSPWLIDACEQASQEFFNQSAAYFGEGGIIPFMGMLGRAFPEVQFMITGVLGPRSNAHGPNEFLHLNMMKKITGCVAQVIAAQATCS
jgi:acetylornithine deacetylase/succinyl-diaminopimelate desuccinylase-like protein